MHELCLVPGPGKSLDYVSTATQPLDFNTRYHSGREVFYPVPERKAANREETFVADSEQEYCLMWTNRSTGQVALSGEYAVAHP